MVRPSAQPDSLRISRPETERLMVALLISLLLHLGVWGTYQGGKKLGWWKQLPKWSWFQPAKKKDAFPLQPALPTKTAEPETFIDVVIDDPVPPAEAKYYSSKNSRAANPDPDAAANQPKVDGKQQDVPKTEDAPKPTKLQPALPAPPPPIAKAGQTAKPAEEPDEPEGDLSPRTLKQVQPAQALPGRKMQQAGGVPRRALVSSLDAKATPFGEYDSAIVAAVTQHWYDLLDSSKFAMDRTGRVTLQFRLYADGRVVEMKTTENNVGPLLGYVCQEAVEQSAPFAKWPPDMVRMIGNNYRDITFSFYYY